MVLFSSLPCQPLGFSAGGIFWGTNANRNQKLLEWRFDDSAAQQRWRSPAGRPRAPARGEARSAE
jgi:hypothetical protein